MKILETQYGKDFVGREYDIEEGKKKIRENGVVVLTGNRGIGKTNLMRVLEDFFKNDVECHYIESGSLFSTEMSRYFLPEKVDTGASHSISLGVVGGGAGRSWSPREETILEGMEKSEEMIIFVENAHELKNEEIQIIFAGTGRNNKLKFIIEIARPYYYDADLRISPEQLFELGKLDESDIVKIVEKECPDFSEDVIKRIVFLSDGYPYIARSLAYICEKKESEADMLVFLNTLKDANMENTLNNIHKGVLATLDEEAQALIKKLALAPLVLTLPLIEAFCGDDADTSLGEVIEKGILREDDRDYVIYHSLFRDYLQKNQRISLKNKKKIYSEAMKNMKSEPDSFYLLLEVLNEHDIFKELIKIVENFDVINFIGCKTYIWGKLDMSVLVWSRLLNVATSVNDNNWISVATGNMGIIYRVQGEMGKALEYHENALKINETIGDKEGVANQLSNMGNVYHKQGEMGKALQHHQKALKIHEEIGDKQGKATDLGNMGIIYGIQGEVEKALEYFEKALAIDEEMGNKQAIATDLGNKGNVYHIQEDMKKALEYFEKALEIHEKIGDKHGMANQLGNMGIIYYQQGNMKKALQHHESALEIEVKIGDKEGIARELSNMGNAYYKQGDMKKALEHYENALEIHEKIGNKGGIASNYNNIAAIYQKQGDIQKVLENFKKAFGIFKDMGDNPNKALILMNIGLIYINKGEKSTALDYLLEAQDIAIDYAPHLFNKISGKVNILMETQ